MKVKVSKLTGSALNFAVKKARGDIGILVVRDGIWLDEDRHNYCGDWAQGGPIIEREKIAILPDDGHRFSVWRAFCWHPSQHDLTFEDSTSHMEAGLTPLIAAMRCFVASKLGDEVDVPQELCT